MKYRTLCAMLIPVFVVIAIYSMFMSTTASKGIVELTDEEVVFYKEAGLKYMNNEKCPNFSNTNESLRYIPSKDKVTIMSNNIFKETLTIHVKNDLVLTEIKEPNVSFTGCIAFHTILSTISLALAIFFSIEVIDEFRHTRKAEAR